MIFSKFALRIFTAALFLVVTAVVSAQDYRGKVQGTITDENGAAVPGANVVLRNVKTGVEVSRATNGDGHYIFDFVEPGEYIVVTEQTDGDRPICLLANARSRFPEQ